MISGPPQAPNEAATFIPAWATTDRQFLEPDFHTALEMINLLGLHFLGKISLGTTYAKGTVANPKPIKI